MTENKTTERQKKRQKRGTKHPNRPHVPTERQKNAIALFEKQIVEGGSRTIEEILIEAGYDPESARQQVNVMKGIRPHLDPIVERMKKLREKAIARAEKTVGRAMFGDAVMATDKLTKNIQLLTGRPTNTLGLSEEDRERIDELIEIAG